MNQDIFALIGGDFRSIIAANRIAEAGFTVKAFGFNEDNTFHKSILHTDDITTALSGADYVILPLPSCTSEGKKINTPLYSGTLLCSDLLSHLPQTCLVLGGMMNNILCANLEAKGIRYADYFAREEFTVRNAIPTAEGAIEIALRETPFTLHSANCLITGHGRISKLLAQRLFGFRANITVSARRCSDLAWIDASGYKAIETKKLKEHIHKYDVIFNTVPHKIFNRDLLRLVKKDCLIIDLASKPGGVDFEAAQKFGLNVIWALSLPGKCAPLTAGSIMCDTIMNIINEQEAKE